MLFYAPLVEPADPDDDEASERRDHLVNGFVRKLPPGAHASEKQVTLHEQVDGKPLEQMQFTQLEMYKSLKPEAVEPTVDAAGFRWMRSNRRVAEVRAAPGGWRPLKVPPGFQLVGTRQQTVPGVPMPVQHLVFSDGFASVSVFIEPGARNGSAPAEASRVGSASTFTTHVRGFVVTAVGEVPPTTVRDLATSLVPEDAQGSIDTSKR